MGIDLHVGGDTGNWWPILPIWPRAQRSRLALHLVALSLQEATRSPGPVPIEVAILGSRRFRVTDRGRGMAMHTEPGTDRSHAEHALTHRYAVASATAEIDRALGEIVWGGHVLEAPNRWAAAARPGQRTVQTRPRSTKRRTEVGPVPSAGPIGPRGPADLEGNDLDRLLGAEGGGEGDGDEDRRPGQSRSGAVGGASSRSSSPGGPASSRTRA